MLKLISKLLCKLENLDIVTLSLGGLVLIVILLRLSLWLNPPNESKSDPNWTSRSLTGWTNTPKKLAYSRTVEKMGRASETKDYTYGTVEKTNVPYRYKKGERTIEIAPSGKFND